MFLNPKKRKSKIILLILCILVFSQGCLFSKDKTVGVTLREGSLILPDKTQISIGDSFESLKSFSPRHLESHPGGDSYFLTSSSSINISIDFDEKIGTIDIYLYSLDDAWTEIERVEVDGMIEVNRGMQRKQLMNILEDIGLYYELDWQTSSTEIKCSLKNGYEVSFRFLAEIDGELESIQYWKTAPMSPLAE